MKRLTKLPWIGLALLVSHTALADGPSISPANDLRKRKFDDLLKKSVLGVQKPVIQVDAVDPNAPTDQKKKRVAPPAQLGKDAPAGANSPVTNSDPRASRFKR